MNKQKPAYESPYCCFHPREVVVGVCANCLKDRLLLLLAGDQQHQAAAGLRRRGRSRSSSISLPKVFALGSSFLQRLDSRHHRRPGDDDDADSGDGTTSGSGAASVDDDSFISIKFEDNGKATWDSSHNNKKQQQPVRSSSSSTVVVAAEHAKRGGVTRWRKQVVGRLLQLARWKRQSPDGKKERSTKAKARSGWIRTLTLARRRAGDLHRPWT